MAILKADASSNGKNENPDGNVNVHSKAADPDVREEDEKALVELLSAGQQRLKVG